MMLNDLRSKLKDPETRNEALLQVGKALHRAETYAGIACNSLLWLWLFTRLNWLLWLALPSGIVMMGLYIGDLAWFMPLAEIEQKRLLLMLRELMGDDDA